MESKLAVGWDLDSTLCSTMHRRYLIPEIYAGRATWDDYSELSANDEPIAGSVALARILWLAGHPQYAISGRSHRARRQTREWLQEHDVPMDDVFLRPEGDKTENGAFKVQQINQLRSWGVEFCLFIEDWGPAAKLITEQTGIPVLGVNPFDEGTILVSKDQLAGALENISKGDGIWPSRDRAPELAEGLFGMLDGSF